MGFSDNIEHPGVIDKVGENLIRVSVVTGSACGNCRAKGSCSIGTGGERTIEVVRTSGVNFTPGEQIKVVLEQSLGIKALGLGYLLPFLLVVGVLVTVTATGIKEGQAGLFSLSVLIPYYLALSLFKDKLKKEFSFGLKKL
jgi:positive regulator of sigma E activity